MTHTVQKCVIFCKISTFIKIYHYFFVAQNCVGQAKKTEDTLSGRADMWRDFEQKETKLSDWLKDALKQLKEEKGPISKQLEAHKVLI